jgi:hypothetical protein
MMMLVKKKSCWEINTKLPGKNAENGKYNNTQHQHTIVHYFRAFGFQMSEYYKQFKWVKEAELWALAPSEHLIEEISKHFRSMVDFEDKSSKFKEIMKIAIERAPHMTFDKSKCKREYQRLSDAVRGDMDNRKTRNAKHIQNQISSLLLTVAMLGNGTMKWPRHLSITLV